MADLITITGWDKPLPVREPKVSKWEEELPVRKPEIQKVAQAVAKVKAKRKIYLEKKIKQFLRKKTKITTKALLPRQKKIIKKVPVQKPQGFFHFD